MKITSLSFLLFCFFVSCKSKPYESTPDKPSNLPGETLAKIYCGSCHEFVSPEMLDKETWKNQTLPEMGLRLGIGDVFEKNVLQVQQGTENLVQEQIYPLNPKINEKDYQKIVDYYLKYAPEKPLPQQNKPAFKKSLEGFEYKVLLLSGGFANSTTTLATDTETHTLFTGSPRGMINTFKITEQKTIRDSIAEPGVFSALKKYKGAWYFLDLGMLGPHEKKMGKLIRHPGSTVVLAGLHKPADFDFFDINQDGTDDIVVCNFGFETGSLAWYDGKTKKENIIKNIPGARNLKIYDLDGDGNKDLVVLYAQALEGISVFFNKGKGKFIEKELLAFSPVYGSSWFQLADFNHDGRPDILYVNGDNADYSSTTKNYHGIRIYENQGNNKFKETFFYPLYGATKAVVADFNQDGELDIAAIAYYRDKPEEGFVYLKGEGDYNYQASTFAEVTRGQWMALEAGDVNGDGKLDLVLGSHDLARRYPQPKEAAEIIALINKF